MQKYPKKRRLRDHSFSRMLPLQPPVTYGNMVGEETSNVEITSKRPNETNHFTNNTYLNTLREQNKINNKKLMNQLFPDDSINKNLMNQLFPYDSSNKNFGKFRKKT